jgi:hypothetical protein
VYLEDCRTHTGGELVLPCHLGPGQKTADNTSAPMAGQVKAGFREQLVTNALGLSFGVANYQLSVVLASLCYGGQDAAGTGTRTHTASVDAGTDAGRSNPVVA